MHRNPTMKAAMLVAVGLAVGFTACYGLGFKPPAKKREEKTVSVQGQLVWTTQHRNLEEKDKLYFFLDSALGLTDIDFHPITDNGWKQMTSPSPDTAAKLFVTPGVTMEELERALEQLASKGKYRTVEITVRTP